MKHPFKKFSSIQQKLAELFDLEPDKNETGEQFRQKIVSTVGYYKNQKDVKVSINNAQKDDRKIEELNYQVIGYDENLINSKKSKGQKNIIETVGTKKLATELFRLVSNFVKQTLPEKYVDSNGNVWQKL